MPSRRVLLVLLLAVAIAGVTGAAAATRSPAPVKERPRAASAKAPELPPLPKMRPRVVEPEAGVATDEAAAPRRVAPAKIADETSLPKPTGAASAGARKPTYAPPGNTGAIEAATALPNGVALPPLEAPDAVKQMIQAGNGIARTPSASASPS